MEITVKGDRGMIEGTSGIPVRPGGARRSGGRQYAALRFGILGPLAAWCNGTPLDLGSPQQQQLLAILLARRNDVVSTDALVEAMWPAGPPPNALQSLRTYVSRLRRIFGADEEDALATEPGGYRLAVDDASLDLHELEQRMSAGRRAMLEARPHLAERELRRAVQLLRGPPFGGLELVDLAGERERIGELMLLANEDLAEALLAQGRHRDVVASLRDLVARHPFHERFWAQLMLSLYRSGRQSDALAAYRDARSRLVNEFGVEPGRELQELERLILLHDRTLDHDMVGRLHGVPRYRTTLIGRRTRLSQLRRRLGHERLLTLTGPAGVGKTRLAAEVAAGVRARFPDGIWWVALESAAASDVASAVVRAMGLRHERPTSPQDVVVARARGARILIILDDCDRVSAAVRDLAEAVLEATDAASILATCREPIGVIGERVEAVEPLRLPGADEPPQRIWRNEAIRLLLQRAGLDARPVREAEALREIVQRLDGLPLAIELAAGTLTAASPAELARSLERNLDVVADQRRSGPARHRTVERALAWSIELLPPSEQAALRRLAIFPGDFDADAAAAVLDRDDGAAVIASLVELTRRSLLVADVGPPARYRLLSVIRSFARGAPEPAGEDRLAARRHAMYYVDVAERVDAHMLDGELGRWLAVGRREHANLLAAMRWSLDEADPEGALRLASALAAFWYRTGYVAHGRHLLDQALARAPRSAWRPRALLGRAWLAYAARDPEVTAAAREAVAATAPGSEQHGMALALLAHLDVVAGRAEERHPALEAAARIFEDLAHGEGLALVEQITGVAALRSGRGADAIRHLAAARDRYRQLRGDLDAGWTLVLLAQAALLVDDAPLAEASAADAVRDFGSRGDRRGMAAALTCLGRLRLRSGEPERAGIVLDEAHRIAAVDGHGAEAEEARELLEAHVSRV